MDDDPEVDSASAWSRLGAEFSRRLVVVTTFHNEERTPTVRKGCHYKRRCFWFVEVRKRIGMLPFV